MFGWFAASDNRVIPFQRAAHLLDALAVVPAMIAFPVPECACAFVAGGGFGPEPRPTPRRPTRRWTPVKRSNHFDRLFFALLPPLVFTTIVMALLPYVVWP